MTRRTLYILALIATAIVALALYASLNWYTRVEYPVRVGQGDEARKNPYLALERFLQRMGARSEFARSPVQLTRPPDKGVLVLAGRRLAFMTPQRVREIDAWVRRGGMLVVEAETHGIDDPLLENYGIEREIPETMRGTPEERREAKKRAEEKRVEDRAEGRKGVRRHYVADIAWPGASKPLRVRLTGPGLRIAGEGEPKGLLTAMSDDRLAFVALDAGEGRVVALSSLVFLRNFDLGEYDHAEFAWRLLTNAPEQRTSMLFLRLPTPSLWQWIREHAWPVLVAAIVLLLLWLGRIVPRFGPLEPEAPPIRRSLLEHLRAAGRFVWSRGESRPLLEAVRDRLWRSALRRRGGLSGLAHSKAEETLASLTGQSVATVRHALRGTAQNTDHFIATTGALQSLEAGLAHRHSLASGKPAK